MAYEQKPGDISIFAETDKRNDRAPDWKGSMIVPEGAKPGDKLEVAMWAKGDRGTMLAGSAKFPRQREGDEGFRGDRSEAVARSGGGGGYSEQGRGDHRAPAHHDLNDDIPF